jgi:VanZ family protein
MQLIRHRDWWRWLPVLGWMGIIFYLSHQPSDEIPQFGVIDLLVKKGAHFGAYFILAWLARFALGRWDWALLLTAVYAISDEYHQTFIPGRDGNVIDVVIDCLGGLSAWASSRMKAKGRG